MVTSLNICRIRILSSVVFSCGLTITSIEALLVDNLQLKYIYRILCSFKEENSDKVKGKWESNLGTIIEPEDWDVLWNQPTYVLACLPNWEKKFKILHRLCINPEVRHRMNPSISDLCTKCQYAVGSFFHSLWSCPHVQQFWITIAHQLDKISKCPLHLGARNCCWD